MISGLLMKRATLSLIGQVLRCDRPGKTEQTWQPEFDIITQKLGFAFKSNLLGFEDSIST